jgi:hypothetical protein
LCWRERLADSGSIPEQHPMMLSYTALLPKVALKPMLPTSLTDHHPW